MARKNFALLVGINDYAPNVGKLSGCLNDVDHFEAYLKSRFDHSSLKIAVLRDSDAIRMRLEPMSSTSFVSIWAKPDDVAVCYDSREKGGFDLADKELAVLLAELARNNPHIAVILDSRRILRQSCGQWGRAGRAPTVLLYSCTFRRCAVDISPLLGLNILELYFQKQSGRVFDHVFDCL